MHAPGRPGPSFLRQHSAERTAAEDVHVEVRHLLQTVGAVVADGAIARLADAGPARPRGADAAAARAPGRARLPAAHRPRPAPFIGVPPPKHPHPTTAAAERE